MLLLKPELVLLLLRMATTSKLDDNRERELVLVSFIERKIKSKGVVDVLTIPSDGFYGARNCI